MEPFTATSMFCAFMFCAVAAGILVAQLYIVNRLGRLWRALGVPLAIATAVHIVATVASWIFSIDHAAISLAGPVALAATLAHSVWAQYRWVSSFQFVDEEIAKEEARETAER